MSHTTTEAIYAIRHKQSGAFVRANGKGCWMSKGAAQSSWFQECWQIPEGTPQRRVKFSEQDEYEIVDILKALEDTQEELDEWIHSNKIDDLLHYNNWLIERVNIELEVEGQTRKADLFEGAFNCWSEDLKEAEDKIASLEDRLRAALAYPMDKSR